MIDLTKSKKNIIKDILNHKTPLKVYEYLVLIGYDEYDGDLEEEEEEKILNILRSPKLYHLVKELKKIVYYNDNNKTKFEDYEAAHESMILYGLEGGLKFENYKLRKKKMQRINEKLND